MSKRVKTLVALAAALALSSVAAFNASATVSGHFTSDTAHTTLIGTEGHDPITKEEHTTEFSVGGGTAIECTNASYHGTTTEATVTDVTITPTYSTCETVGGAHNGVAVHMNGCHYTFRSAIPNAHGTVSVICPPGKAIDITHPNCTITVHAQSPTSEHMKKGVVYTTTAINGKHALTVDITVEDITATYHDGLCIFLGTNQTADMTGSVTLRGQNTAGEAVGITAT